MSSILDKRLVYVTGKGGVGKSAVSAALGLAAAARGKRVILCEVAGQERVSRAFRREGIGYEEAPLAEGLWAISIDPEHSFEEYLHDQLRSGALSKILTQSRIFSYLTTAAPGVRELATIGKIWELAQLERRNPRNAPYDLVIVDAPATGHGLAMLGAPRTIRNIARVGPIRRQADDIHSFIVDPERTGVVVVAAGEEMPVNETLDFDRRLEERMGMAIEWIVVNGLYPNRFTGTEAGQIEIASQDGAPAAVLPALRAALFEHRRAKGQRAQLRRLRRRARTDVATLPYLFEPELGLDGFERLAGELERRL